jgi:hypothetical protein
MTYRSHLRAYPTENGIRRTTIVLRCTAFIRVVVAIAWNDPLIMPVAVAKDDCWRAPWLRRSPMLAARQPHVGR